jgi:hypothetical protein
MVSYSVAHAAVAAVYALLLLSSIKSASAALHGAVHTDNEQSKSNSNHSDTLHAHVLSMLLHMLLPPNKCVAFLLDMHACVPSSLSLSLSFFLSFSLFFFMSCAVLCSFGIELQYSR